VFAVTTAIGIFWKTKQTLYTSKLKKRVILANTILLDKSARIG
jgi:hypothetical protein